MIDQRNKAKGSRRKAQKTRDKKENFVPRFSVLSPQSSSLVPRASRIGLFGGAFNPIHLGHLRAGIEIQEAFSLNQVLYIPTAVPPHKETLNLLPFAHRLKMVRLAIAGHPFFKASDVEKKRKGKSYTIQTVRFLKKTFGPKVEVFFIVGLDAFLEINTWKSFQELFGLCHFVVMDRPGYRRNRIKDFLLQEISPDIIFFAEEKRFLHPGGFSVYLFPITLMDISSTQIRLLRQKHQSIRYLLPDKVEDYIESRNFYAS